MRHALRELNYYYGDEPAAAFGPRKLLRIRDEMAASGRLKRSTINSRLSRIKRFWK